MDKDQDYQIFIGLGKTRLRSHFVKLWYVPKIMRLCRQYNLGFTIMDALGGFTKNNTYIVEYSLVLLIAHVSEEAIRDFSEKICKVLKQDSVLLRQVNAQTEFISQN